MANDDDAFVFDKAEYHSGGDWPEGLDQHQSFVHTGMYLAWLLNRDLVRADAFYNETGRALRDRLARREVTGAHVEGEWFDGALTSDLLTEEGERFSRDYYDLDTGLFIDDYEELLAQNVPDVYYVQDSWENFDTLVPRLDQRFEEWRNRPPRRRFGRRR